MATHTIGTGKVNLSTTFDAQDARLIGRIAFSEGKSRNEWVRAVVIKAARRAREMNYRAVARSAGRGAMMLLALVSVSFAIAAGSDMRMGSRTVRSMGRRRWEEMV